MFSRNGHVMRIAYPQGFQGDEVDICETLRLYIGARWQSSGAITLLLKLFQLFVTSLNVVLSATVTIVASIFGFFLNGTLYVVSVELYGEDQVRPIRVPYLYEFLGVRVMPTLWICLGLSIIYLMSVSFYVLLMMTQAPWFDVFVYGTLIMGFVLIGSSARNINIIPQLRKYLKDSAPPLGKDVEFVNRMENAANEIFQLAVYSTASKIKKTCFRVKVKD